MGLMMETFYLVDWKNRTATPYKADSAEELQQIAQNQGREILTEKDFQDRTGAVSKSLRKEGEDLGKLASGYAENPEAYKEQMIQAGYDPRETSVKVGDVFSTMAPATTTAIEKGMGVPATIGGAGIDVAGAVAMGAGNLLRGMALKRGLSSIGSRALGIGADVASGAVSGGVQRGYGNGGFDPEAAKISGAVTGGVGTTGAALSALGKQGFKTLSSELSGVAPEALEAYSKSPETQMAIKTAKGAGTINEQIRNDLANYDELIPEKKQVDQILSDKTVDTYSVLNSINDEIDKINAEKLTPVNRPVLEKLLQWRDDLSAMNNEIPAQRAFGLRQELDGIVDWENTLYDKNTKRKMNDAFKSVAGSLRNELKVAGGKEYENAMKEYQRKVEAKKELENWLGTETQSESKLDNIFNRNKTEAKKILAKFDDVFGKGYTNDLRNSYYAKSLGIDVTDATNVADRSPSWLSRHSTGKANTGLLLSTLGRDIPWAKAVIDPITKVGFPASSPRIATGLMYEMNNPSIAGKSLSALGRQGKNVAKNKATEDKNR